MNSRITISRVYWIYEGSALAETSMTNVSPATGGRLKVEAHTDFAIPLDGETRTVKIDDEEITYTDVDETTDELVNITRGANSTVAAAHDEGTFVYVLKPNGNTKREKFADGFIDDDDALAVGVEIRRHLWPFYTTGARDHDEMEVATVKYLSDDHPVIVDSPETSEAEIIPFIVPMWSVFGSVSTGIRPHRFAAPISGTIEEVYATASDDDPPTGDDLIIDILKNGTSILTTKVIIADGFSDSASVEPTTKAITKYDALQVEVEQVGSTTPGKNVTVWAVIWPTDNSIPPRIEVEGPAGQAGAPGADGADGADGLISEVQNEGVAVTDASVMDFTGSGVNVTSDGSAITVDISGGGGFLARLSYNPASQTVKSTTSTSASLVDVDATNLAITFTAPASGDVLVVLSAFADVSGTGWDFYQWGLREGTTKVAEGTVMRANTQAALSRRFLITGLTAGNSYTYKWAYALLTNPSAASARIIVGQASQPFGPAIMEVHAA